MPSFCQSLGYGAVLQSAPGDRARALTDQLLVDETNPASVPRSWIPEAGWRDDDTRCTTLSSHFWRGVFGVLSKRCRAQRSLSRVLAAAVLHPPTTSFASSRSRRFALSRTGRCFAEWLCRRVVTGGVSFSCSFTASSIRFGRVATPSGMTCDARRRACHNQQCVSQANALVPFTLRFGGRVFSHSLFRSRVASLCPLRSLNGGFSLTPGGFISSEATLPRAALSCPAALFPRFLRVGEFVD